MIMAVDVTAPPAFVSKDLIQPFNSLAANFLAVLPEASDQFNPTIPSGVLWAAADWTPQTRPTGSKSTDQLL